MRGKYRKYKDSLVKSLLEGDTEANVDYLADTLLEFMEQECERCMSNRMMCALRPACPNRKFLNILLRFGVDVKDLPSFCYKQQISNVNTFIEGSSKTKIIDTVLPIKEFLNILSGGGERLMGPLREGNVEKLSKELFKELKRATPDVLTSMSKDYILALVDDGLYYFDLPCEIVIINPRDTIIKSKEIISDLIDIYRERYKLDLELREEFEGLLYLDIFIPLENSQNKEEIEGVLKDYEQKFLRYTDYISNYFSDNKLNLVLEIKTPTFQQKNNLTFKNVINTFTQINNLIKEINQLSPA
ncbi:MAG: hypothetical protein ACETWM_01695 [Candidatus Lokiarchaeia archaeon]